MISKFCSSYIDAFNSYNMGDFMSDNQKNNQRMCKELKIGDMVVFNDFTYQSNPSGSGVDRSKPVMYRETKGKVIGFRPNVNPTHVRFLNLFDRHGYKEDLSDGIERDISRFNLISSVECKKVKKINS